MIHAAAYEREKRQQNAHNSLSIFEINGSALFMHFCVQQQSESSRAAEKLFPFLT
jgi:hypothetical protein